jgi:hypothetical protein
MITKKELELLSNYVETDTLNSNHISYMALVDDSYIELQMRIKSQNRELAIDALIEGKEEEYKNRVNVYSSIANRDGNQIGTISPRIVSTILKNKIADNSPDNIFSNIVSKLENLTSGKSQFDINFPIQPTTMDSPDARFRKLVTKIMTISNLIAIESRMGAAHSVIIGDDIIEYFLSRPDFEFTNSGNGCIGTLSVGMPVFWSEKISKNKVILIRGGKSSGEGLNIVNDLSSGSFFLEETPTWSKYIKWFSVI